MNSTARTLIQLGLLLSLALGVVLASRCPECIARKLPFLNIAEYHGKLMADEGSKAFRGFNLITDFKDEKTYLLSMKGKIINRWPIYGERVRLLPNGNLLTLQFRPTPSKPDKNFSPTPMFVREYRWDGSLAWEYLPSGIPHHDIHRLANGNTLFLMRTPLPEIFLRTITDPVRRNANIRTDSIVEVTPAGEVAWQWDTHDYLDVNSCGRRDCNERVLDKSVRGSLEDWLHPNTASPIPENKWYRAGDTRFKPGNIMFLPRNWSTVFIIDKESKKIVWEYTGSYKGGLSLPHEAHMIEDGLPGAGNVLIFDNGYGSPHHGETYFLEVDPTTKNIEWSLDRGKSYFSNVRGLLSRLPNGNTFVSDDVGKRIYEINREGKMVWGLKFEGETRRSTRITSKDVPMLASYSVD